jgi:TolB-like protein/DNA-binding winged helix-turn-helix (wHTH) protein/Flp pilus assembly protein TadD
MDRVIRFGEDFELDADAYELRRAGLTVRLERIPMEILLLFAERRGQLVTREQIVERVWGKDRYLDVDNSINGAIRKIRQVLSDNPEQPRFILTVTGRGYRFIAPVRPSPGAADAVADDTTTGSTRPAAATYVWLASLGLLAIGFVAAAFIMFRSRSPAPEGRVMVAVLPFDNLTGDRGQEYFSDGLTEEMITQLGSRDPGHLGVIARTSVMHYKGDRAPMEQIVRELGVQYVLEGGVRREANQIRISAQLIRAADQTQLWSRQYDRKTADLLTLQGEIAQAIANEIQSSLGRPTAAGSDSTPSRPAFAAYDLYLRGMYAFNKRTVPELENAVRYFEGATVADPQYARAYAALADAYALLAGYSNRPPQSLYPKALAAAQRALVLDSSLAEAHTAFALIVQNNELDWQTAEREFRRAIALNPNYATAHHWYAEHLMWRGRFDEALQESERARQLDPLSLIIAADNGFILYCARQYDRAIEKWRSVLAIDPDFPRAHLIEAAYIEKGMVAEARADFDHLRTKPPAPVYWGVVTGLEAASGDTTAAHAALRHLLQAMQREPVAAVYVAGAYVGLGDRDQSIAWLERAYAEHPSEIISLKVEPAWDPLRDDPRFQRLLERMGLAN